ncbi:MAG: c-type cytochrome [Gammaproteobacteria bacterium]|nr:c-type cytochrome [Gammaproteobacteria bacterium]MDH3428377.1 c-type cytochrome [Gammaproteobacteria bacterium]MDH3434556.1 c-type cytochrome [Gammaproteobacteria bacterium]
MNQRLELLVFAVLLASCGPTAQDSVPQMPPDPASAASNDPVWLSGKKAYDENCAYCHEQGLDGAPRTGDQEAWDGRSWLWEAVLFEHARTGFGEMPAKGGDATLDEAAVTKAAEYMLNLTYPDTHRD